MQTTRFRSDRCPTCGRRRKRSNPQNALYWALLQQMADQKWNGAQHSRTAFHLYFRGKYLGCDDVKLPNGTTMTIPKSTADLDVAEFGDYFDKVQADCAERGIYLADLG